MSAPRTALATSLIALAAACGRAPTPTVVPEPELIEPPPPQAFEALNPAPLVPPHGDLASAADRELRERVQRALDLDPELAGAELAVGVEDGVVTLGGVVANERQREHARALAAASAGVRRVEGDLVRVE